MSLIISRGSVSTTPFEVWSATAEVLSGKPSSAVPAAGPAGPTGSAFTTCVRVVESLSADTKSSGPNRPRSTRKVLPSPVATSMEAVDHHRLPAASCMNLCAIPFPLNRAKPPPGRPASGQTGSGVAGRGGREADLGSVHEPRGDRPRVLGRHRDPDGERDGGRTHRSPVGLLGHEADVGRRIGRQASPRGVEGGDPAFDPLQGSAAGRGDRGVDAEGGGVEVPPGLHLALADDGRGDRRRGGATIEAANGPRLGQPATRVDLGDAEDGRPSVSGRGSGRRWRGRRGSCPETRRSPPRRTRAASPGAQPARTMEPPSPRAISRTTSFPPPPDEPPDRATTTQALPGVAAYTGGTPAGSPDGTAVTVSARISLPDSTRFVRSHCSATAMSGVRFTGVYQVPTSWTRSPLLATTRASGPPSWREPEARWNGRAKRRDREREGQVRGSLGPVRRRVDEPELVSTAGRDGDPGHQAGRLVSRSPEAGDGSGTAEVGAEYRGAVAARGGQERHQAKKALHGPLPMRFTSAIDSGRSGSISRMFTQLSRNDPT